MSTINANMTPMRYAGFSAYPHCLHPTVSAVRLFILAFISMICRRFWTVRTRSLCLRSRQKDLFYGTILTTQRIELPRGSRIVPDGAFSMESRYCRPAEFEQEYGAA